MNISFLVVLIAIGVVGGDKDEEKRAKEFLKGLNERTAKRHNRIALANWAYASNITDQNLQNQVSFLQRLCFIIVTLVHAVECKC